jgi:uncharacterized OB-fold protein
MTSSDSPLPERSLEAEPFWEATAEERFLVQFCPSCDRHVWYPRALCPYCLSQDLKWVEADGDGTVYTYSIVHEHPSPAWADNVPYVTAIIHLDSEDIYVFSQLVDVNLEDVGVGLPITVTFDHVTEDLALPKFRPREA